MLRSISEGYNRTHIFQYSILLRFCWLFLQKQTDIFNKPGTKVVSFIERQMKNNWKHWFSVKFCPGLRYFRMFLWREVDWKEQIKVCCESKSKRFKTWNASTFILFLLFTFFFVVQWVCYYCFDKNWQIWFVMIIYPFFKDICWTISRVHIGHF